MGRGADGDRGLRRRLGCVGGGRGSDREHAGEGIGGVLERDCLCKRQLLVEADELRWRRNVRRRVGGWQCSDEGWLVVMGRERLRAD